MRRMVCFLCLTLMWLQNARLYAAEVSIDGNSNVKNGLFYADSVAKKLGFGAGAPISGVMSNYDIVFSDRGLNNDGVLNIELASGGVTSNYTSIAASGTALYLGGGTGGNIYLRSKAGMGPSARLDISGNFYFNDDGGTWNKAMVKSDGTIYAGSAGTPSLPGYSFRSDPDNGITLPGTDMLGLVTFGHERVRIGKTGVLALFDADPDETLITNHGLTGGYWSGLVSYRISNVSRLYAVDQLYNNTVLSSHVDPADLGFSGKTSFNDKTINMPYSFSHFNPILGKGEVVDIAKLVSWAEKKMQEELGNTDGRLVYEYDLPDSQRIDISEWEKSVANSLAEEAIKKVDNMAWIQVTDKNNNQLPAEAVEIVDEMKEVQEQKVIEKRLMDLDSMSIKTTNETETVKVLVPTGKKIKTLKKGWIFKDGELFRKPTINDINVDEILKKSPKLPEWLSMRAKNNRKNVSNLKDLKQKVLTAIKDKTANAQILCKLN